MYEKKFTYFDNNISNPFFEENLFVNQKYSGGHLPDFKKAKSKLPSPLWEGHEKIISCYWKAWELAFGNLHKPTKENGFITEYIDTAFNGCIFMWDSSFILMFGFYGRRIFDFQKTLDNFYAKQHPDGFICREIDREDGEDQFHRYDPASTGPNLFPWIEWVA